MKARQLTCAVLTLLLLAGCGDAAGSGDPPPSGAAPTSSESGHAPTELPTDLRECPPEDKGEALRVPDSVARIGYDVPPGFSTDGTGGLGQIQTAEGDDLDDTYYMLDRPAGIENLAWVHYRTLANGPVADACDRLDLDEVLARLADHNEQSGSEVTMKPELIELAGMPVVVEERTYPSVGITVVHHWIYGRADMLNIQCQWTSHEDEVRAGCAELIGSLRVG
ncbi:hypothetical protein [Pseudactinotalea sp.]|uniref:hypothetical protein n=1 Tax=Pseudactinotalea sp. TaxID=1926260 RepID=UPI003B3A6D47